MIDITNLTGALRRAWLVLVASLLLGGVAGWLWAESKTPIYQADVSLLVGPINTDDNTLRAAGQLGQTYAELAKGRSLREAVVQAIAPGTDTDLVVIAASANEVTRILSITVRSEDGQLAVGVAAGLAERLVAISETPTEVIDRPADADPTVPLTEVRTEGRMTIVEDAVVSEEPVSPDVPLTVALAAVAALLAAVAAVVVNTARSTTIHGSEDLGSLDVPLVVTVAGSDRSRPGGPLARRLDLAINRAAGVPGSLQTLGMKLQAEHLRGGTLTVLVSGTRPQDGSEVVAAQLALAFASLGRTVLLEVTTEVFGDEPGSTHFSLLDGGSLRVVPSAHTSVRTRRTLTSPVSDSTADDDVDRSGYDVVVVHTPTATSDLRALTRAAASDHAVVVVRCGVATAPVVSDTIDVLRRTGTQVAGIVLDERPTSFVRRLQMRRRVPRPSPRTFASEPTTAAESAA